VPEEQVHQEVFHPSEQDTESTLERALVAFGQRNLQSVWSAEDNLLLLKLAEEAGLTPSFGCRSGTCGLCSTKLNKGEINYTRKPSIDVPAGEALLCSSRPASDIELNL